MSATRPPSLHSQLGAFVALLVLLSLTAGSALVPMGAFNVVANVIISIIKTLLVMTFFMRLRSSAPLLRIAAAASFGWLAILIGLSLADYLTRTVLPAPW